MRLSLEFLSSSFDDMYMFIITRGVRGAFFMSMICRYGEIVFRVGILSILPENDEVL